MRTTKFISQWKEWEELCEYWDVDPHKTVDFGIDEEGGNSTNYEYIGDYPKPEEE